MKSFPLRAADYFVKVTGVHATAWHQTVFRKDIGFGAQYEFSH